MKQLTLSALVALSLAVAAFGNAQAADKLGADRHIARGLTCEVCHGPDKDNRAFPDEATCTKCHVKDAVAAKTAKLEPNPHKAPHNGDCTLCHTQHEPAVNYCAQCHKFDFKVP